MCVCYHFQLTQAEPRGTGSQHSTEGAANEAETKRFGEEEREVAFLETNSPKCRRLCSCSTGTVHVLGLSVPVMLFYPTDSSSCLLFAQGPKLWYSY